MSEAVEILALIAKNKSLPSYSAETRLDAYLCFYIEKMYPEIEFVVAEFPIKKTGSNQSTKVDLLCVHKETMKPIFIEFKTDSKSFNKKQANSYEKLYWKSIVHDLFTILKTSKSDYKVKYLYLIKCLMEKGLIPEHCSFPNYILSGNYYANTVAEKGNRSRKINAFAEEYCPQSSNEACDKVEVWYLAPDCMKNKIPNHIKFVSFDSLPDNIKPKSEVYQTFIKLLRAIE